jgi:alpha-beta hydrolase superfamily lysophospholipase
MADGTILRTIRWEPAEPAWAVAEIVHGLGEHGGRHGNVAAALAGAGIDTWAYDLRGNGGSGGPRVYVDRWSILHDDLETRLTTLRELHPGKPLILYGHSLGGLLCVGYVLSVRPRPLPDLLVLSAPSLDDNQPWWQRPAARLLDRIMPRLRLPAGIPSGRSGDAAIDQAFHADPLCSSTSTVHWGAEAFREQDRLNALLPSLTAMPVPTYVLHGSEDPIVPVRASEVLAGLGNVTRRVHEGLRHEQHHEREHAEVLAEVVAWIRASAPAADAV